MFDHIGLQVADLARSRAFYTDLLAVLGHRLVMEIGADQTGGYAGAGFGPDAKPQFWIGHWPGVTPAGGTHVALSAASRAQVDASPAAARAPGARDNGAPGLRPHYHPGYYAAFVLDPDGHNIEAVCHGMEP